MNIVQNQHNWSRWRAWMWGFLRITADLLYYSESRLAFSRTMETHLLAFTEPIDDVVAGVQFCDSRLFCRSTASIRDASIRTGR
jgi:hypothetical protein